MIVFLCDLDDTLFSTKGKIEYDNELTLMSTLKDGGESGFSTKRQQRLIDLMSREDESHQFIAVTARDESAFFRVKLQCKTAILAHGGIILRNGVKDVAWMERNVTMAATQTNISCVYEHIAELDKNWRHWAINDGKTDLYYVIKHQKKDMRAIKEYAELLEDSLPEEMNVQQNGNNIAITPSWLSKLNAVEHILAEIRSETPDALAIGMGDSLSDLPFMLACDYGMFPGNSQVSDSIKQNIIK